MQTLRQIRVRGLFGLYDHDIPLQPGHITILHGPNGVGKTALLRLVDALFTFRNTIQQEVESIVTALQTLFDIPFTQLTLLGEDGTGLMLTTFKVEGLFGLETGRIEFTTLPPSGFPVVVFSPSLARTPQEDLQELRQIHRFIQDCLPDWAIHFTQADRLQINISTEDVDGEKAVRQQITAEVYTTSLGRILSNSFVKYDATAKELERTYPRRVLARQEAAALNAQALRERLDALVLRQDRLTKAGLMPPNTERVDVDVPNDLDASLRWALTLYVQDLERKLDTQSDLLRRIEAFQSIFAGRFLDKQLVIDPQRRYFYFCTVAGVELEPYQLSSGEQHQFVMFYDLLFGEGRRGARRLILLDEPELSLHLEWQERFLEDLQRVVDVVPVEIVVATHSPLIVGEHSPWLVPLRGLSPEAIAALPALAPAHSPRIPYPEDHDDFGLFPNTVAIDADEREGAV